MKSEKGITVMSLTVYVIVMAIIISVVARISTYFYANMTDIRDVDSISQYTKFSSYFTEEINTPGIKILECESDYVVFDNGVQYTFSAENNGIYRNKVKICNDIEECVFEQGMNGDGKVTIKVAIKAKNDATYEREPIVYTLR